jgi:glycosyltransferase involved in cell wall biosynthesis
MSPLHHAEPAQPQLTTQRLVFDLRFVAEPCEAEASSLTVTLAELAALLRKPRDLLGLLRGRRYGAVCVREDDMRRSGVQAGAVVIAAFARCGGFEIEVGEETRILGRSAFLARALLSAAVRVPAELLRTVRLLRRVDSVARIGTSAPVPLFESPCSVAYLRAESRLTWKGAYVGGAAAHTTGVINGLLASGLDVDVFAAEPPACSDRARFVEVPLERVSHLVSWLTATDFGERLARKAAGTRADFVYQRYALGSYAGLLLAGRLGVPLVLEFNGSEVWATQNWGVGALQQASRLLALEQANLRGASLIVVVSEVLHCELIEQGFDTERIVCAPNGVDADAFRALRAHRSPHWRAKLDLAEAVTIGFIGTFGLWHGVSVLPAIIERVSVEAPQARWVLIGDGPLREEVRAGIERRGLADRVYMPGVVPHASALQLLAACEVCVSPHIPNPDGTRFFGSPTKLFEYMGLGRAIVASDLEQIGEVIEHERNGLLCEPGDVADAAAAVVRLIGDPALRARLGENAFEDARSRHSWKAHVQVILDALVARNGALAI